MAKQRTATLLFPLPEEQEELDAALNGMRYRLAVEEFLEVSIRRRLKYGELPPEQNGLLEALRRELLDACEGLLLT